MTVGADRRAGAPQGRQKPLCVIAHTIKGKGVSFMEDQVGWHHWRADPLPVG